MATETIEFVYTPGLTLTADLFPRGSDTALVAGLNATERTSDKGTYRVATTAGGSGWHRINVKNGANVVAKWWVKLTNTTTVVYAEDALAEAEAINGTSMSGGSAEAIATEVWAQLEDVPMTAPAGPAANFREMLVQVWRRFFKKQTLTATQLTTYADDGSTPITVQALSDNTVTQTVGAAT